MKKMVMMCAVVAAALCARAALPEGGPYTEIVDGIEWTFYISGGEASVGGDLNSITWKSAIPESTTGDIVIPTRLDGRSVTSIRDNAFTDCRGLTRVTIPSSVTSIEGGIFVGCDALEEIVVTPGSTSYAVYNKILCNKEGSYAIHCPGALKSVTLPSSVTRIRRVAFRESGNLTDISVEKNSSFSVRNRLLCDTAGKTLVVCPSGLSSIDIPSGVTAIGEWAFRGCDKLTKVVVPSGVTSIGRGAFEGCSNLSSVTIPSSTAKISDYTFTGCGLEDVTIPIGVTSIGFYAFSHCANLTSISVPPSVTTIDSGAFVWDQALSIVHVEPGDSLRVRAMLEDCLVSPVASASVADQVTIIEDYDPEPGPTPPPEPEPEEGFEEAHTFNGLVYAGEVMCGIVQVTTGKRTAKDQVKVGGFVMLTDGKKQTIKGVTEDVEGGKVYVETKAGKLGDVELEITDNGFTGSVGPMTVKSGDVGEDTGIISGTLKMSYFDAKTNKLKTRSIKLGGVASGGEAAGTLETKGEETKVFEAVVE